MFNIILRDIHSTLRWITLLIAAAAFIKHLVGWLKKSDYDAMSRGLMSGFSGTVDLNATLGILLLILRWKEYTTIQDGFPLPYVEHAFMMIAGAVLGHLPMRWKDKPANIRYRNNAILIVVILLLIITAVALLPGSRWVFRSFS